MSEQIDLVSQQKETIDFFIYNGDQLLIKKNSDLLVVPKEDDLEKDSVKQFDKFYIGEYNLKKCYAFEVTNAFAIPQGYKFEKLYNCRSHYSEKSYRMAARSFQILNWNRSHIYCGVCGFLLDPMTQEGSKTCAKCGKTIFQEISPAIIVAIFKENKILLAHNRNFSDNLYSLIAGFVEMSETLEETVEREIFEEVGIRVKNIRYFRSQPWPFPNSLMLGFTAEYASGEIKVDGVEITDADWFTPDCFPVIPGYGSIARTIIDQYVENYKG